jgi:hypothetical protein
MRREFPFLWSLLLAVALAVPLATTGCAEHHYRVYDPYYNDYHQWDNNEVVYYNQWTVETHRDPHRDFKNLNNNEKKEYWTWRHSHEDHDKH